MVTRTFHPVGQGAFYTEVHEQDETKFTIVYDCGSSINFGACIKSIDSIFPEILEEQNKETIDILFISHFHADHINGLKLLEERCNIKKVVIPFLNNEAKALIKIANVIENNYFDTTLVDNPSDFFSNAQIITIEEGGNTADDNERITVTISDIYKNTEYPSGTKFLLFNNADWLYIPYNYKQSERFTVFLNTLTSKKLTLDKLGDIEYINLNIDIIKEAYEATGKKEVNINSLVLYSGKAKPDILKLTPQENFCNCSILGKKISKIKYHRYFGNTQSGCLYLGDIDLNQPDNIPDIKKHYSEVLRFIGTIQVPHHGSRLSFNKDILELKSIRNAVVSFGTNNTYHHPCCEEVIPLLENQFNVFKVTELVDSKYVQEIN